jgi:hypothetical protein
MLGNMFRAITRPAAAPADNPIPIGITGLGYHFTTTGQLLNTTTNEPFMFHGSSSERANYIRKDAVQQAVRTYVLDVLRKEHNILGYYLDADNNIHSTKPGSAHVPILMTEVSELVKKRDVVVYIGEGGQELGIWAWRMMRDEGFLSKGTAIGLVEELSGWGTTLSSFGEVEHARYGGFDIEVEEVKVKYPIPMFESAG